MLQRNQQNKQKDDSQYHHINRKTDNFVIEITDSEL